MLRLSYNGVIHAALCLAKDSDDKPMLVHRDVYDLLTFSIIPFLALEYLSLESFPTQIKPPDFDEQEKHTKMARWTSAIRTGHPNPQEDKMLQEGAFKIVVGSGLWAIIHLLAMIVEKEPSNTTARRALNFAARSTVVWIACPMCSEHWGHALDDVDNSTKESTIVYPQRPFERMTSVEVFNWTLKIHNIASGSDKTLPADLASVRSGYVQRYNKLRRSHSE